MPETADASGRESRDDDETTGGDMSGAKTTSRGKTAVVMDDGGMSKSSTPCAAPFRIECVECGAARLPRIDVIG